MEHHARDADPDRRSAARSRRAPLGRGVALLALGAGLALAFWVKRQGGVELDPDGLRTWIEGQGWRAPLVFVLAAALRPFLLLPSWILMAAGGLLFGVIGGTVFGAVGFTLGGLLAFGIARGLGRDAVEGRLSGGLARLDGYLSRRGPRWLAVYTALPISPLTPAYSAAGLSGMAASTFAIGVAAGLVPRTLLFSYFGDTLASGDVTRIAVAGVVVVAAALVGVRIAQRSVARDAGRGDQPPEA